MLNPSPEIVREMIKETRMGSRESLEVLRLFVSRTCCKSGRKTIVKLAEAILDGVESGELPEVNDKKFHGPPPGPPDIPGADRPMFA